MCRGAVVSRGQHTQHLARLNLSVGTNIGSLTVKLKPLGVIIIVCFLFKTSLILLEELGSVLLQSISA